MKVIVSHDVDHLFSTEHLFDGVLLKFVIRAKFEWLGGILTFREFRLRLSDLFHRQWHHIDELMDFDAANGIPSTFFFAMNKGKGLNYSNAEAKPIIERVVARGFDCGVHGIGFEDQEQIDWEYQRFKEISGKSDCGIRMHYLRRNEGTLEKLNKAGYLFDSSEFAQKAPYKIGNMVEFPLHIMDSDEFYGNGWRQRQTSEQILKKTKAKIDRMEKEGYPIMTLLFHDRYFGSSHEAWQNWYIQIIRYLKKHGHTFTSYQEAVDELS